MTFGTNEPVLVNGKPRCRFPYLVSYAYLRQCPDDQIERILSDERREVLLDSGAFTAFNAGKVIELSDYIGFLKKWAPRLFGYMLLDKLQDPVQTEANWKIMLDEGLSPVPIHVFGEGAEQMEAFFARSPYVALGGLRRPHRGPAPDEYVKQKMAWANGRPVHWLGYTKESMIRAFRPFSVDCASAWGSMQFGQVMVYHGFGRWWQGGFDDWLALDQAKRRSIRASILAYDVDPDALNDPLLWRWGPYTDAVKFANADALRGAYEPNIGDVSRSHLTAILSIRSFVRYIYDIRRNFGTRVFLACGPGERHDRIVDGALELANRKGWDRPLDSR